MSYYETWRCLTRHLLRSLFLFLLLVLVHSQVTRIFLTYWLNLSLTARHLITLKVPGEPLGLTNRVTHTISLQPDAQPSNVPSYRLPHSQRFVVQQEVDKLHSAVVIQESHSPWNSLMFLMGKKDGSYRPVIDFRKVTAIIVSDHYPLPILSDILQSLGDSNTVFSSINLLSGFWQIPLDAKSREISAFSTPSGHYEWLRLPIVNSLFAGVIGNGLFVYLDDLIVVSKDLESHSVNWTLSSDGFEKLVLRLIFQSASFSGPVSSSLGMSSMEQAFRLLTLKFMLLRTFLPPQPCTMFGLFLGLQSTTVRLCLTFHLLPLSSRVSLRRTLHLSGMMLR